jgi:malonate-semialdehyde dehydrogenase (acetylating) / methylmalonate-semialdehyde dehydrogenase
LWRNHLEEEKMQELSHWIDGQRVAGTSGRFADVFNPATGEVQARVPLASKEELDARSCPRGRSAGEMGGHQPAKARAGDDGGRGPDQPRHGQAGRDAVLEHGKTFPDAKGDIQRGLEVIEFCIGAPHLLKGEFTDSAGPGIDMYSMRQPLGVVAGITPFNFPAMIPLWKMGPRWPAAMPSSSSPPSVTPRCR